MFDYVREKRFFDKSWPKQSHRNRCVFQGRVSHTTPFMRHLRALKDVRIVFRSCLIHSATKRRCQQHPFPVYSPIAWDSLRCTPRIVPLKCQLSLKQMLRKLCNPSESEYVYAKPAASIPIPTCHFHHGLDCTMQITVQQLDAPKKKNDECERFCDSDQIVRPPTM